MPEQSARSSISLPPRGGRLALVFLLTICGSAAAAVPTSDSRWKPYTDFIPKETTWLLTLQFNPAVGKATNGDNFFSATVERRPGFRRLQRQMRDILGIDIGTQIKRWWMFGATHGPKSGTSILRTSVNTGVIINQLKRHVTSAPDFYDGVTIYRIAPPARHRPGPRMGPIFVAVFKPGLIIGSLSEKSLEHSLDCHMGVQKHVSAKSQLLQGYTGHEMLYFSLVHVQRAINQAQNPLMVPPQIRAVKAIHLAVLSLPKAIKISGYLQMLSAAAAKRSAARLKELKKMAYRANSGANATDRQMAIAGAVLRLKVTATKYRVRLSWRIPYSLLKYLQLGLPAAVFRRK
jgi:hypothetical protein